MTQTSGENPDLGRLLALYQIGRELTEELRMTQTSGVNPDFNIRRKPKRKGK